MTELLFNLGIVLFFVLLNGFFVAAEFAIVKVRSTQIEPLARKGNLRARIARDVVTHLDAYLSATQLGITMTSLALGWIGEPFVAYMIEPWLAAVGVENPAFIQTFSFGIAFAFITFLHIVLGELAPKSLAIQKPTETTLAVAYPLKLFYVVFRPIIWALNTLANRILSLVGISPASEVDLFHSEEELRLILTSDPDMSEASKSVVLRAMDFRKKQARHVMIPRKDIIALSDASEVKENLETMRRQKFSRYPVYHDSLDNVVGIVHTKDIFKQNRHLDPAFRLPSVYRDVTFLPETASLQKTLETMLQKKTHMLMLGDEYGGTAGLVTLEDVLEEIVGTIQDEFDRETPEVVRVSESEFIVDGFVTTNDVERLLDVELSGKDIFSIGGFVIEQLGHIPAKGEVLQIPGAEFVVEKVEENAVWTVRVRKVVQEPLPDERTDEMTDA